MTIELTTLLWSAPLALTYLMVQASLSYAQIGQEAQAGARDNVPEPNLWHGRARRALRNSLETYPVFIALVVVAHLADRNDALTTWGSQLYIWGRVAYLPLYITGVRYIRSLVWLVSLIGLVLLFVGVLF